MAEFLCAHGGFHRVELLHQRHPVGVFRPYETEALLLRHGEALAQVVPTQTVITEIVRIYPEYYPLIWLGRVYYGPVYLVVWHQQYIPWL